MEILKTHFQNWVLSWNFVKREMYTRVFKEATDEVLESLSEDVEERANELVADKLNALLTTVDLHKIVTLDKNRGICYIGGERAEPNRLANLRSEAEFLLGSEIWQLLYETPKELAQRRMFTSGESLDDMKAGRSILYTLSTQKNILDMLKSYEPK